MNANNAAAVLSIDCPLFASIGVDSRLIPLKTLQPGSWSKHASVLGTSRLFMNPRVLKARKTIAWGFQP